MLKNICVGCFDKHNTSPPDPCIIRKKKKFNSKLNINFRFGSQHITPECKNKVDKILFTKWTNDKKLHTLNSLSNEVQTDLRKRTYNFKKSEVIISEIDRRERTKKDLNNSNEESQKEEKETTSSEVSRSGPVEDTDIVKLRLQEKKKVHFKFFK